MRDNDPRFPSNVDQRYITWTQYVEFHTGSNSGPAPPSDSGETSPRPEPISQEELDRRARLRAEMAIQDQAEETRRNIIRQLRVEEGRDWDYSFAMMIRMEQNYIQRKRNLNASPYERAMVIYMLQNPLRDVNDWASRQGNAWCVKLNKDAARKQKSGKRGASQSATAPPKPNELMAVMILGVSGLVILGLVGWWVFRRFF